jgi:hypothetical protein
MALGGSEHALTARCEGECSWIQWKYRPEVLRSSATRSVGMRCVFVRNANEAHLSDDEDAE